MDSYKIVNVNGEDIKIFQVNEETRKRYVILLIVISLLAIVATVMAIIALTDDDSSDSNDSNDDYSDSTKSNKNSSDDYLTSDQASELYATKDEVASNYVSSNTFNTVLYGGTSDLIVNTLAYNSLQPSTTVATDDSSSVVSCGISMLPSQDLLAYFPTNEGSGIYIYDQSLNMYSLTVDSSLWTMESAMSPSLYSNDAGPQIRLDSVLPIDLFGSNGCTFAMWVYRNQTETGKVLAISDDSGDKLLYVIGTGADSSSQEYNVKVYEAVDDDGNQEKSSSTVSFTESPDYMWIHVACTVQYDEATSTLSSKLYINGEAADDNASVARNIQQNPKIQWIKSSQVACKSLVVYNRALSESELQDVYNYSSC